MTAVAQAVAPGALTNRRYVASGASSFAFVAFVAVCEPTKNWVGGPYGRSPGVSYHQEGRRGVSDRKVHHDKLDQVHRGTAQDVTCRGPHVATAVHARHAAEVDRARHAVAEDRARHDTAVREVAHLAEDLHRGKTRRLLLLRAQTCPRDEGDPVRLETDVCGAAVDGRHGACCHLASATDFSVGETVASLANLSKVSATGHGHQSPAGVDTCGADGADAVGRAADADGTLDGDGECHRGCAADAAAAADCACDGHSSPHRREVPSPAHPRRHDDEMSDCPTMVEKMNETEAARCPAPSRRRAEAAKPMLSRGARSLRVETASRAWRGSFLGCGFGLNCSRQAKTSAGQVFVQKKKRTSEKTRARAVICIL